MTTKVTATRPMEEWPRQLGYYQSFEQLAATYREVAARPVEFPDPKPGDRIPGLPEYDIQEKLAYHFP